MNTELPVFKFTTLKEIAKTAVPAGARLCRIINKGTGAVSVGSHLPMWNAEETELLFASPVVVEWLKGQLYGVQDKIVRGMLDNSSEKQVSADVLAPEMVIAFLSEESASAVRLSKEGIESWFDTQLAQLIASTVKAKNPNHSDKVIADTVMMFKIHFTNLAKKEVSIADKIKAQLEKALALLPDEAAEDKMTELIAKKIADSSETVADLDAL